MRRTIGAGLVIATSVTLAACSTKTSNPATASRTTAPSTRSTTSAPVSSTTTSSPAATTTSTGAVTTTTAPATAQNLTVTSSLRAQLLAVAAAMNNVPVSGYTGLAPTETYYAYDPATSTYWAGAALVPSSSSTPAQVSVQDDGSYVVFSRSAAGAWAGHPVGATGEPGSTCPVAIPPAVVALWGWPAGTCKPQGV